MSDVGIDAQAGQLPTQPQIAPALYLQLLRSANYRWWRPLAGIAVFVGTYLNILLALFILPGVVYVTLSSNTQILQDAGSPLIFLLTNLSLALLIPCAMFAVWAAHRVNPGILASVTGRFRWGWFAKCFGLAVLLISATAVISSLTDSGSTPEHTASSTGTFITLSLIIVLTTPLQAAGEEFAFRGYLGQAIGAWVKFPIVSMIITSTAFALAHGGQSAPLFLDRFGFGMVAAYLVLRTGGLEVSIALHTVNNLAALLTAAAFSDFSSQLVSPDAPWALIGIDVIELAIFVVIIEVMRSRGLKRGQLQTRGNPTATTKAT